MYMHVSGASHMAYTCTLAIKMKLFLCLRRTLIESKFGIMRSQWW